MLPLLGRLAAIAAASASLVVLPGSMSSTAGELACDDVVIVGHRGAGEGPDENTLPHMAAALDAGVDAVEFDVRRLRGGVLGVMHDRTVNRTTDGRGLVNRYRWRAFRRLNTASGYSPPSFAGVVGAMAPHGAGLQVHLKVGLTRDRLASMHQQLLKRGYGPDSVQVNSDKLRLLTKVRRVTGLSTGYTYVGPPDAGRIAEVAGHGVDVVVFAQAQVTAGWVDYAESQGLQVGARGRAPSQAWAAGLGIRRLVVDEPVYDCL